MYQGKFEAKNRAARSSTPAPEQEAPRQVYKPHQSASEAAKAQMPQARPQTPGGGAQQRPVPNGQRPAPNGGRPQQAPYGGQRPQNPYPNMQRGQVAKPQKKGPHLDSIIFYTLYFLFIAIFAGGTFLGLNWLDNWLVDYEAAQPTVKCQEVFDELFGAPDWGKLYDLAGIQDTAYEGMEIEQQAVQMLLLHVGTDLCRLAGEMDKLVLAVAKGERTVTAQLVEKQTGVNREYNDFELQTALANHDIDRAARIVKFFQGNPRSFALQRVLSNLFTFFSDVMIAFYSPDRSDRGVATWLEKADWAVRKDIMPALQNYSGVKTMLILDEIRKADARSKGLEGVNIPAGEVLQDLVFFILH